MPISVQCGGCSKRLNVKDEYIGKRIKCPGCGQTFLASPASAGKPASPGLPTGSGRAAGSKANDKTPRIHVSPGMILLVALAIILPTTFFLYRIGPGRVRDTLAKDDETIKLEITDVVDQVIQSHLSQEGGYNPLKAHNTPHTIDVTLLLSPMYMTMPDSIGFAGTSTEGAFHGQYHPKSHEVQVEVEVGGMTLSTGILVRHGTTILHGTGRSIDGKHTAEIDGKTAEIRQPRPEE